MKKYLKVFNISLAEETAYKTNFVMARVRSILQIFLLFFLWDAVFRDPGTEIFGYNRTKILTYVFGTLLLKALVENNKVSTVSGIIASGDFINYLLKPLGFTKYWLIRDAAAKIPAVTFALLEAAVLYLIVKPPLFMQTDILSLAVFILFVINAIFIFFLLMSMVSMVPFWMPEQTWPATFLFLTVSELLSGAMFPLDVFPQAVQKMLYLTPFPYLIFIPLQAYLGLLSSEMLVRSLAISFIWLTVLGFSARKVLSVGLKEFRAEGR